MDFLIDNWMLVAIAIISASMLYMGYGRDSNSFSINDIITAINKHKAVVIDVGDSKQSIQKAKRVALADLPAALPSLVKNKSTPVVLVCPRGLRASHAQRIAKKLGYENAMALQGGLKAWATANLPMVAINTPAIRSNQERKH